MKIPVPTGRSPDIAPSPNPAGLSPLCSLPMRFSDYRSTSRTSAAALPEKDTWRSRRICFAGKGMFRNWKTSMRSSSIVSKVPDAQVLSDLDAAVEWAAKNKGDAKRLGVTGFCWGGRVTWLYAAHSPESQSRRRLVWTPGRRYSRTAAEEPDRHRADAQAPVLGLYGGQDQGIPLDTVEKMRAALEKSAGIRPKSSSIRMRRTAFSPTRVPSYRKEAAAGRLETAAGLVQEIWSSMTNYELRVTNCEPSGVVCFSSSIRNIV